MPNGDAKISLLRHTLATLVYRLAKTLREAPPEFASYRVSNAGRTPLEILAHVGDLLDWALHLAQGESIWRNAPPLAWPAEAERFFAAAKAFDDYLAAGTLRCEPEKLFQGPVADALTHTGQLAMLRRLGGWPIRGENYFVANICAGQVGAAQPKANKEFD